MTDTSAGNEAGAGRPGPDPSPVYASVQIWGDDRDAGGTGPVHQCFGRLLGDRYVLVTAGDDGRFPPSWGTRVDTLVGLPLADGEDRFDRLRVVGVDLVGDPAAPRGAVLVLERPARWSHPVADDDYARRMAAWLAGSAGPPLQVLEPSDAVLWLRAGDRFTVRHLSPLVRHLNLFPPDFDFCPICPWACEPDPGRARGRDGRR
jgi:hypothetical protein